MGHRIRIHLKEATIYGTLNSSTAAKDFVASLPMTVEMEDYDSKEKIFYPTKKLSIAGSPKIHTGQRGEICLYSPWGNIALFYENSIPAPGLIPLGQITRGLNHLAQARKGLITIESAE